MKVPGWVCDQGDGTFDHDWKLVSDWGGDPEVIGGTFSSAACTIPTTEFRPNPG